MPSSCSTTTCASIAAVGRISAKRRRLQSSDFTVRLPRAALVPAVQAPLKPVDSVAGPAAGLRVLVADDSRDIAESMEILLTMDGFDVLVAFDGEQAFELARTQRPDAVLLDLGMPKLNGYQVAQRIREQPWGARMTLIAQTGWGQESDRQRTRDAGFDHHIVKPVDPTALSALLSSLASKARPTP